MVTLRSYLKETHTRQEDFAAAIGVTQATISRFVRGVATPSIELAAQIKRATQGAVDFDAWVASEHHCATTPTQFEADPVTPPMPKGAGTASMPPLPVSTDPAE